MEVLSFDIVGKFAHFRKYYSNSSALSFSIPPRTTIIGILAAIVGKPKESYYNEYSSENIRITISVLSPIKKSFQRLNYLMVKSWTDKDFRGALTIESGHVQTPFEVITPENLVKQSVKYRIYISFFNEGEKQYNEIKENVLTLKPFYNISLGVAPFSASLENINIFDDKDIEEKQVENEIVELDSAVLTDNVEELYFEKTERYSSHFIEEELLPADFKDDYDRELSKMIKVLFTTGNIPLKMKFNGSYYKLRRNGEFINIQFLD